MQREAEVILGEQESQLKRLLHLGVCEERIEKEREEKRREEKEGEESANEGDEQGGEG